jgi:hypothetical protein
VKGFPDDWGHPAAEALQSGLSKQLVNTDDEPRHLRGVELVLAREQHRRAVPPIPQPVDLYPVGVKVDVPVLWYPDIPNRSYSSRLRTSSNRRVEGDETSAMTSATRTNRGSSRSTCSGRM